MANALAPLADVDPKAILARYLSDESTKDIAASYGVTRQALGQFLMKTHEEAWKSAQVARAGARKERAEDKLAQIQSEVDSADQEQRARLKLSLACAEAELRAAQWDLERVCRRIYGQDQHANSVAAVQIHIGIAPRNQPIIERTVLKDAQVIE